MGIIFVQYSFSRTASSRPINFWKITEFPQIRDFQAPARTLKTVEQALKGNSTST
jgi:hypothetical protein